MAEYDGSVRIKTEIDSKNVSSQFKSLENHIAKTADKVASLRAKMDSLKNAQIPTEAYIEVQKQITETEKKLAALYDRQEKFLETGGKTRSSAYKKMQYDISQLESTLAFAKSELQDLVDTGRAFTIGSGTQEYANLGQQLGYAESELTVLNIKHDELIAKQNKTSSGYKKMGQVAKSSLEKVSKEAEKSSKSLDGIGKGFKNILKYGFGIRSVYLLVNKLRTALKEGFENLAQYSSETNASISSVMSALTQLKNSFATAFAPILNVAAPAITKLINLLSAATAKISEFMSALTGKSTYIRAVKVNEDYAESLNNTASAAKKAANALYAFDELNVVQQKDDGTSGATGTAVSEMFEEVPIDSSVYGISDVLKEILGYAKELKDVFAQGFFNGLGDWQSRWESIKDSLASIKESVIDIWTDSDVMQAADEWLKSLFRMFGSLAGSVVSIGMTIAINLIGGISRYLKQNKDRIKTYLTSMFEIGTEINQTIEELSQSISSIFEAFSSEEGQQFTANTLGIILDTLMGISEIAMKVSRDILSIFSQPIIDNAESIKTALIGVLGVLEKFTGTIKQGIDDTFNKFNEVYDEHLKPFFDSISSGLSDTAGKFLSFWTAYIQPILEKWAEKFDILWTEHLQPALNNFLELFGSVADFIKGIYEQKIKPLIDFIIQYILPGIANAISSVGDQFFTVFEVVSDIVGGIIKVIKGIIDFVGGVFAGDWEKAWGGIVEIFSGIGDAIKGIVNGILSVVESLGNGVVDGVNEVIAALNRISFDIPDWIPEFGGKSFGFNIQPLEHVSIPRLATGAVLPANKPFMAVVGDQKHGTNVEAPLDTIKQAVRDVLQDYDFGGQGGDVYISAEGDLDALVRLLKFRIDKENKRVGKNFEKVVTV